MDNRNVNSRNNNSRNVRSNASGSRSMRANTSDSRSMRSNTSGNRSTKTNTSDSRSTRSNTSGSRSMGARKEKKVLSSRRNLIAGASLIALIAILVAVSAVITGGDGFDLYALTGKNEVESTKAEPEVTAFSEAPTESSSSAFSDELQSSALEYAYAGFEPRLANMSVEWNMLLLNRCYCLPDDFEVELAEAVSGTGMKLDKRVAPYYQNMYDAAAQEGVYLTPISGYRSVEKQHTNFSNKISYYKSQGYDEVTATKKAAETILLPGTSEHNAGLAMDIISLDQSFDRTKAFLWLKGHAADYGFILRYPKDKTEITGVSYEPWHWRYVGEDVAKELNTSGKCLEEYLNIFLF